MSFNTKSPVLNTELIHQYEFLACESAKAAVTVSTAGLQSEMISELRRWEQNTEQVDQPPCFKFITVIAKKDETETTGILLFVSSTNRARGGLQRTTSLMRPIQA